MGGQADSAGVAVHDIARGGDCAKFHYDWLPGFIVTGPPHASVRVNLLLAKKRAYLSVQVLSDLDLDVHAVQQGTDVHEVSTIRKKFVSSVCPCSVSIDSG